MIGIVLYCVVFMLLMLAGLTWVWNEEKKRRSTYVKETENISKPKEYSASIVTTINIKNTFSRIMEQFEHIEKFEMENNFKINNNLERYMK